MAVVRTPKNILLVEDEPTLQRILGSVLTDAGHRVESVGTAEQALERLQNTGERDIDLVLSDKNLPAMSGLDLLAQVRAFEKKARRAVGFVLVTGYPSRDSALAVLNGDGDGYLVKPFRSLSHAVDQIQAVLSADLTTKRAGRPLARSLAGIVAGKASDALADATCAVLVDDAARAGAIKHALAKAHVTVDDVGRLPATGRAALLASRVEDLQAYAKGRAGAALVLVDGGASFSDIVALIGAGGGAIVEPVGVV